jgi:thiamine biosynthesis lipoprotein
MMSQPPARASFPAFGGTAIVAVVDGGALGAAVAEVRGTIAEFDQACSRFRSDSELTALNRADGAAVMVGPVLLEAVTVALGAAWLTDGDVDPTVGGPLIALGYDRDFVELMHGLGDNRSVAALHATTVPGWRGVEVDIDRSTIRLARGVTVDLGATAKALAADRAATRAAHATGCGTLVSLSGDIALAGEPPSEGWLVRVTDDHRAGPGAAGQSITLRTGGLATSSTTVRRWAAAAGEAHHLLDPATARPVYGAWRTASVSAATCVDANVASTAAIVRGEAAADWLATLALPARLVSETGEVVHVAGWPADGDDLPRRPAPVPAAARAGVAEAPV